MPVKIDDIVRINCNHANTRLERLDVRLTDGSTVDVVMYYDYETDACLFYYPDGAREPYPGFEDELVRKA